MLKLCGPPRRRFVLPAVAIASLTLARLRRDTSLDHADRTDSPAASTASSTPSPTPEPSTVPPGFHAARSPPVVNSGPRTGSSVALTFDADMTTAMAARLAT